MTNQDNATAADPAAEWTPDRRYRHLLRCAIAFLLPGRMHKVAGQTRAEVAHQLQVMLADVESFVTTPAAHVGAPPHALNPRRPYQDHEPSGYQESDRDYMQNNEELVLWYLENDAAIRTALALCAKRPA